ncbi:MAG: hypothetical protein R3D26_06715 [Cyanobacteriota/Melainabacteria group bacterium]
MHTSHIQAKDYSHLKGLNGISDETMEIHFGLYNGYVNNTNILNEKSSTLQKPAKAAPLNTQN